VYVDDFVIATDCPETLKELKDVLMNEFKMRDLGELSYFLGIKIERKCDSVFFSQSRYVEKLIIKFKMKTSKPKLTPLEAKQMKDIVSEPVENRPYRALIGCLMYAYLAARPDLCIAVNFFSQYQRNYHSICLRPTE
jgi:histone deacetylase 1/2